MDYELQISLISHLETRELIREPYETRRPLVNKPHMNCFFMTHKHNDCISCVKPSHVTIM